MLWVIIFNEYKSLSHKPCSQMELCDTAVCCDSQSDSICSFTWHKSQILQLAKAPKIITEPPPCFMVGVIQRVENSFTNSLLHIYLPIWFKDFELWFVSPKTLFYCSITQCLCALADWSFLTLFCFLNSGFLRARGLLHYVFSSHWILTFFSWHWFSCAVMFGAVSLLSHKLVTQMKLSAA